MGQFYNLLLNMAIEPTILVPPLDDIKELETEEIQVMIGGYQHHFFFCMFIVDDLAAYAIGEYFCNFSTAQQFCRFCNCCKK